ncbi:MAG: putative Ig domain-containing protein [Muribaculaceae bacterium]|nr:putative Ig domain-containing protein [Muribaculaceae bacterium]
MKKISSAILALALAAGTAQAAFPIAEKLDRGVVAVKTASGTFISWRSLTADDANMTFDVYRDGTKVNAEPITAGTNLADGAGTASSKYVVKALVNGTVVETSPETSVEADVYRRLTLDRPTASGCTYTPNDMSVGDIDGDGKYELFVKWDPSNSHDNSEEGKTGNVFIDCYTFDGKKLWRIDLGQNIRAGAHYTQFMVYDFDLDGKAEMICKTAPGTKDATGKNVIMGSDDPTKSWVNSKGHIIDGPEYLTVFDGKTGAEINTIAYNPPRTAHAFSSAGWGDSYGGRSERYLAGVAYLDGVTPSAVFCRGYYTHSYLWAVDYKNGKLTERWLHASTSKGKGAYGEGAHSLTVGDCDGDGFDEIVYGSAAIDHDGSLLYRTGGGHGDALHLGDFDPDREGLEVFMVHEEKGSAYPYDADFRDAKTGEVIWSVKQSGNDIGRGLVADLSDKWRGHEAWPGTYYDNGTKTNATFDCKGNLLVNKRGSSCFRIYWDGDLLDELYDGKYDSNSKKASPVITKRNSTLTSDQKTWSFSKYNAQSCNTTKATPCLQADIMGDWREELIMWDYENPADIMIFTTTETSKYRVPCLMEDHNYRLAIAWQNTGYNQPPHLGYNLAAEYSNDPSIKITEGQLNQAVELGFPIAAISGTWAKAETVTATGLPEGVSLNADNGSKTFTITGTPTAEGNFAYKLTATGEGGTTSVEGSFTVSAKIDLERVAHFSFDQIGSTVTNHVQGEAKVHGNPTAVEGKAAGAISLNGTTDYLTQEAYDKIQMGMSDFTIEFLMKSTDDAAYILHKGSTTSADAAGATGNWIGFEYKNGNLKFAIDDDAQKSEAAFAGTDYFNGQWHHIVLVRESATKTLKAYADGVLMAESSDDTGAVNDNNELLVIGNVNNKFDNFYEGALDDFSIYRGAMSANKVKERFDSYSNTGIIDINFDPAAPKHLTLYNAINGVEVATGVGEPENVTTGVEPGVYILVIEQGNTRYISKIKL